MHHAACQELFFVNVLSTRLLRFLLQLLCAVCGYPAFTLAVPTLFALQDFLLVKILVRLLAHSSCLSRVPGCAVHL